MTAPNLFVAAAWTVALMLVWIGATARRALTVLREMHRARLNAVVFPEPKGAAERLLTEGLRRAPQVTL